MYIHITSRSKILRSQDQSLIRPQSFSGFLIRIIISQNLFHTGRYGCRPRLTPVPEVQKYRKGFVFCGTSVTDQILSDIFNKTDLPETQNLRIVPGSSQTDQLPVVIQKKRNLSRKVPFSSGDSAAQTVNGIHAPVVTVPHPFLLPVSSFCNPREILRTPSGISLKTQADRQTPVNRRSWRSAEWWWSADGRPFSASVP